MRTRPPSATKTRIAAVIAVAAAATAALAPSGSAAGAAGSDHDSLVAAAIASAESHLGASAFGAGQQLRAVGAIVDRNGTSHVRMHRTYRGLDVLGGDLVV